MEKLIQKYDLEETGGYLPYTEMKKADGGDYLKRDDVISMLQKLRDILYYGDVDDGFELTEDLIEDLTTYDNGIKIYPY